MAWSLVAFTGVIVAIERHNLLIAAGLVIITIAFISLCSSATYLWPCAVAVVALAEHARGSGFRFTIALALWSVVVLTAPGSWLLDPRLSWTFLALPCLIGLISTSSAVAAPFILLLACMIWWSAPWVGTRTGLSSVPEPAYPFAIQTGIVMEHVANDALPEEPWKVIGPLACAREMAASTKGGRIFALEHDPELPLATTCVLGGERHQPEPWGTDGFVGDHAVLFAIGLDGQLVSNIGTKLSGTGRLILGGIGWDELLVPLCIADGKDVYFFDSDPFGNKLSPYCPNFLRVLAGNLTQSVFLCSLCIGASFFALAQRRWCISVSILLLVAAPCVFASAPRSGEVRLSARVGWPHEQGGFEGVLRAMVEDGLRVRAGIEGTSVLLVQSGTATHSHEKLVVLGPGASVTCESFDVVCLEEPLGELDSIVDARSLRTGTAVRGPRFSVGNVTFIGTGSPARLPWRTLCPEFLPH